jgi:recombination DNA repair RAD52 pathway protein
MKQGSFTAEQYQVLRRPLNSSRVAKRSQGGKELSYLEAFDVRAHLIRCLGFGNFDVEVDDVRPVFEREVEIGSGDRAKPGIECAWMVRVTLTIRDPKGRQIARYREAAVGSATGSVNYGDLHDNAVKQGASDALKRCAINLGNQFGLSLYANGSTADIVRRPLVFPDGAEDGPQEGTDGPLSPEAAAALEHSLGATTLRVSATEPQPDGTGATAGVSA